MKASPRQLDLRLAGWILLTAAPALYLALHDGVHIGNGSDLYSYQLPMRRAARQAMWALEAPWWNPDVLMGVPLLAGWQLGLLYPVNVLGGLLPTEVWSDIGTALHLAWLSLGAHALAHTWLRRPIWAFSWEGALCAAIAAGAGPTWGHVHPGHISFVQAWAWLPWAWALCLLSLDRPAHRTRVALAAAVALQLLAGHPQVSYMTAVGALFVVAAAVLRGGGEADRQLRAGRILGVCAAGGAGVGLAAAQWAPALWLAPALNRDLSSPDQIAMAFSAKPAFLLTAAAPAAFGGTTARLAAHSYHETLSFIGAAPLALLALAAGRLRASSIALWAGLLAMLLLAPGKHGPLLPVLYDVLPGLGAFRVPSRWVAPAIGLGVLLCVDVAAATPGPSRRERHLPTVTGLLAAALLIALAATVDGPQSWLRSSFKTAAAATPAASTAAVHAGQWLALTALTAGAAALCWGRARWQWAIAVASLLALGQSWHVAAQHLDDEHFRPAAALDWPRTLADGVHGAVGTERLATAARLRQANWGGAHGVAVAGGYEPVVYRATNTYANRFAGRSPERYAVNLQVLRDSPYLSRAAASHLLQHAGDRGASARFAHWPVEAQIGALALRSNPRASKRLAFAERSVVFADSSEAQRALATVARDTVTVDRDAGQSRWAAGAIEASSFQRNTIDVRVKAEGRALLVLRDTLADGWSVTVDGAPADPILVDGLFRGVVLPAGKHAVQWRYWPPGLVEGLMVSLASLALVLWWWRQGQLSGPMPLAREDSGGT